MTHVPRYFSDFLTDIRPDDDQLGEYQEGHKTLRERLHEDAEISKILVSDFLQGSYRRWTAIRPEGGQKSDVDIVAVTTIPDGSDTGEVRAKFERFLNRYDDYRGNLERKTHSIGIALDKVELDLVVTSAPSQVVQDALAKEARRTSEVITKSVATSPLELGSPTDLWGFRDASTGEWKTEPLRIPNFDDGSWGATDPLTQIAWTTQHNADCGGHYVNVVKALKWWRRTKCPKPKHPKGYPVEHVIGDYCPSGISSVAEGVVKTLERIRDCPILALHLTLGTTPFLPDRGIREHNVWKRIAFADFSTFMTQVTDAATIAREAFDLEDTDSSVLRWYDLFSDPFHKPEDDGGNKGDFTPRKSRTDITPARFG